MLRLASVSQTPRQALGRPAAAQQRRTRSQAAVAVATGPRPAQEQQLAAPAPQPPPAPAAAEAPQRPALLGAAAAPGERAPPALVIPRSIEEVGYNILGFSDNLSEDHPGFNDEAYKRRRTELCLLARAHRIGDPIPRVAYTPEETAVWGTALSKLRSLFPQHACEEFLRCWPLFEFREDTVPQLQDLSAVLAARTGFRIRPVAGLLDPRDFLAGLAFSTFHSTQYLRHASRPMYTPEPDLVHEVIGHVPMLADPCFCDLVRHIGIASLGASDADLKQLTRIYWYTVEFGVVRPPGGAPRAFGAGILSSYGELEWMAGGGAALEPLDCFSPLPRMSYKDGYQTRYFYIDSFEAGAAQLRAYCAHLQAKLPDDVRAAVEAAVGPS